MPFDRGTVFFRICLLPEPMPDDCLERFSGNAAGPLEHVTDEPRWGWVSGRHLLERRIDEQTAYAGGYLHLALRRAERKVPQALLRAECRMVELARQEETQSEQLNSKERRAIKAEITAQLLPKMPPQLSGIPFVVDSDGKHLYVSAASQKRLDMFLEVFRRTIGFEPIPLTPATAATTLCEKDAGSIPQLNFSPELPDAQADGGLGQNFLTWLWFFQEECGGVLPRTQLGEFALMLDGPLTFVADGPGALESAIRKGLPTVSAEAKAALLVGKKLKRAKVVLSQGSGAEWSALVDADELLFRGVRLPQGEALDPDSVFEERMNALYTFRKVFFALFQRFIAEMTDGQKLAALQKRAKKWVREKDEK